MRENVSLAPFTTLGIGGPARFLAEAASEAAVLDVLAFADGRGLPLFVLGGGSNILVSDRGFPGVVLRVALRGIRAGEEPGSIDAAAGEDWDAFVAYSVEQNWAGLECLSGIPGTVGGAPIQNIGAYGAEIGEVLVSLRAVDRSAGRVVDLARDECGFAYRSSRFNTVERDRFVVLQISCALRPDGAPRLEYPDLRRRFEGAPAPALAEVRAAVRQIRAAKSMLLVPGDPDARSAGSFFKNPIVTEAEYEGIGDAARRQGRLGPDERVPRFAAPTGRVKVAAAWLIERAGFTKGYGKGRAGVSTRHTLALVNRGGASAGDIVALADEIREGVAAAFGVRLATEPVMVGFE